MKALSDTDPQIGSVGAKGVGVGVKVDVLVGVEVGVLVWVGVRVGVLVLVGVLVRVAVNIGVSVRVEVGPCDGVQDGSTNTKIVLVGIMDGNGILVRVWVDNEVGVDVI